MGDENWDIYSILLLLAAFRFSLIKSLVSKLILLINLSHNMSELKRKFFDFQHERRRSSQCP